LRGGGATRQREVYHSAQKQYAVRSSLETETLDEDDTEDEEEDGEDSGDEDDLLFKEMDNLAKLDTNPQKIAMMVDALNSNYQHAKVFESARFTNSSQKTIQTNPNTFVRSPNTHVIGNGNSVQLNNNQYQNYYQAPHNYSHVNNVVVAPIHPPQQLPQAPNTAYYVQNRAPPQAADNNSYIHGQPQPQPPPVYYYPPGQAAPQSGYYYVPPHTGHYTPAQGRTPQAPSRSWVASPQALNFHAPMQPSSPQPTSPSVPRSSPVLARRTPKLITEDCEYPSLPEEHGDNIPSNDIWKKFVHNLPFKPLAGYSTFLERVGPNLIKGSNAIIAPIAKQYHAGLFVVVAWKGDFNFDVSLNSVFSSRNLTAIKHKTALKTSKGVAISKIVVIYMIPDSNDYTGEYEFTFTKDVQSIAKCIVGGTLSDQMCRGT